MKSAFLKKKCFLFLALGVLLTALAVLSLLCGKYPLSLREVWNALAGNASDVSAMSARIVFRLRLPRTVMAVLAGAALGLAGCVYQTIFENPLASPDLIGVAGGANLGAAVMIVLGEGSAIAVAAGSFLGALGAVFCVMMLAMAAGKGKISFILGGIVINAASSSCIMALKAFADPENELASIEYWEMGSLGSVIWSKTWVAAVPVLLAVTMLLLFSRAITLMSLGDDECRSLGLRLKPVRAMILALNTLLVASVVSVTGLISFVGLVAPHIANRLYRYKGRLKMILSAMVGSLIVTGADILARTLGKTELPISVLTALTGVPVLILLLLRKKGETEN